MSVARAFASLLLTGLVSAAASAATVPALEPRILAQQGLAIGLASTVLQTQLNVLLAGVFADGPGLCAALQGSGSEKVISSVKGKTSTETKVTVYYDNACKTPYVAADAIVTFLAGGTELTVAETALYTGPGGTKLGTLKLNETAKFGSEIALLGTGSFAPATGAPVVSLGLQCTISLLSTGKTSTVPCAGAVAQRLPAFGLSIASLTPLALTAPSFGTGKVTFVGTASRTETSTAGLTVVARDGTVAISSPGTRWASTVAAGGAGAFTLFPPKPTAWTVTDKQHDAVFSIALTSNVSHVLVGSVTTISTGTPLATIKLNESGTGTISYAGGITATVTNWLIAG